MFGANSKPMNIRETDRQTDRHRQTDRQTETENRRGKKLFVTVGWTVRIHAAFVRDVTSVDTFACLFRDGLCVDPVASVSGSSDALVFANALFNGALAVTEYAADVS